jgi:DNA-binding SARP family transcriptional activator
MVTGMVRRLDPRLCLLGPMEARDDDGAPLALGPPKQRTVFALLVLRRETMVTLDEIVDELWDRDVPRSAIANVQTYVANLRRLLGAAGSTCVTIEGRGRAYVARVRSPGLDVELFGAEAERGRAALAAGRWADAADALAGALALWRGEPVQDVPAGPVLRARTAALVEERLAIVEDHAEAALALGRSSAVVAALRGHVDAFPLRERGWRLLMTALADGGQVAAALAAYAQARRAIVEQLGIEPGPALRDLQQALLSGRMPAARRAVAPAPIAVEPLSVADPRELRLEAISYIGHALTMFVEGDGQYWEQALRILEDLGHAAARVRARLGPESLEVGRVGGTTAGMPRPRRIA